MLKRVLSVLALTGSMGLMTTLPTVTSPAMANSSGHQPNMEADGFTLWNAGEMNRVAFDVWTRPAREGGGFYYFLWGGQYANIVDYGSPEVVVYFDSNIAQVNGAWMQDCYDNASYGEQCQNAGGKPVHFRHVGSCTFPWQFAVDGSQCGDRAATVRQGGF